MAAFEIAFMAKDVFVAISGLIDVELEGLRRGGVLQVEVKIVNEVSGAAVAAQLLPPKRISVGRAAAQIELHSRAIERRRGDTALHRERSRWPATILARA